MSAGWAWTSSSTACSATARISTSSGDPCSSRTPSSMRATRSASKLEHAVDAQDVGDEVVGEQREAVEAGRRAEAREGEVAGGDLGALEERDVAAGVRARRRARSASPRASSARSSTRHGRGRSARKLPSIRSPSSLRWRAKWAISACSGSWPKVAATSGRASACELGAPSTARGRAGAASIVRKPGQALRLVDRRKPAAAEVDRVELQAEGGAGLVVGAVEVRRGRRLGGQRRARRRSIASCSMRTLPCLARDTRGGGADVVGQRHAGDASARPCASASHGRHRRPVHRALAWFGVPADAAIDALLEGLNPPQRDAVIHGEGPLLILAGAGSGKTRVLTHRIAYLLRTGQAKPSEILAITFTNKAAPEMRERVELLVGRATRAMWVMTFHAACARMLRSDAHRLGYTRQFTIYDSADQRRLIKRCLDDLDVDVKRFTPARDADPDLRRQEQAALAGGLPPARRLLLRADRRRRLRAIRARAAPRQRDGLRRPPGPLASTCSSSSRRSATATPAPSAG